MPLVGIYDFPRILFFFFSVSSIFLGVTCIFLNSNVLNVLIPWYPFPSLNWVLKLSINWDTVSHAEIVKQCIPQNNLCGQHDHTNAFIDSFQFYVSLITLYSYLIWYQFFFVTLFSLFQLLWFFCIHCKWLTFSDMKNVLHLTTWLSYYTRSINRWVFSGDNNIGYEYIFLFDEFAFLFLGFFYYRKKL